MKTAALSSSMVASLLLLSWMLEDAPAQALDDEVHGPEMLCLCPEPAPCPPPGFSLVPAAFEAGREPEILIHASVPGAPSSPDSDALEQARAYIQQARAAVKYALEVEEEADAAEQRAEADQAE